MKETKADTTSINTASRSRVVILPCASYDDETVFSAVEFGVEILGGIRNFIDIEDKILVKPNFLSAAEPEKAVTTHPAVIGAVFRLLSKAGCKSISCGDSPGHGSMEGVMKKMGLTPYLDKYDVCPADMKTEKQAAFPDGLTAKSFHFAAGALEADSIISVSKMKTHALEKITGAVKNIYGCICGAHKAAGHLSYPNASVFARMLCDIHRYLKPRLHIMDGIIAMEGNGPGSGDPKPMNVIIISADPVAINTVFCNMVLLDPEAVPTNVQGQAMGIGHYDGSSIEVLLAEHEKHSFSVISMKEVRNRFGDPDFNVDRSGDKTKKTLLGRYSELMTSISKRPVINKKLCIKCGICVSHCPVPGSAINFRHGKEAPPEYDYKKCIRCYCCQEMCPEHAITVKGHRP